MKKVIFIFLFIFIIVDSVNAQGFYSSRRDRTTMLSFGLGLSNYNGDLHDVIYDGLTATPNAGIGLRKKLGSQLSFRVDFNWYQISGTDSANQSLRTREVAGRTDSRKKRNLSFRSNNLELSAMFLFNLVPINNSYTTRPILNPYIFAGVGLSTNNPKTFYEGDWVPLRPLQTELTPYPGRVMVIPIGFGVRLKATESVDILLEAGYRRTFTDYLDDVSTDHVDKTQFDLLFGENTEKAALAKALTDRSAEGGFKASAPGDDRGNPLKNDSYYIFQVRLEMYLGNNFLKELFSPSRKQPKFR
ncbi:DUF6089 family protein [Roseivirga echinicomitans]|uniref:DUF6089 domain-containing protein n=1 Tax=Roseivirga echinicomitans TaxID=296218 RepID=A0A150XW52_9BACT|nr:DUF6089 family protein [Roseivirga echinicomitans]KYG82874.1 hypothetical protein AWN68_13905 [Roseivirga echinicomitans]